MYRYVLFVAVGLAGIAGHELAHWLVWWAAGRRPTLSIREVRPTAGPRRVTPGDRAAAAAPYALGLTALVSGLYAAAAGAGLAGVLWAVFGAGMVVRPSRVDLSVMLGRGEWAFPVE